VFDPLRGLRLALALAALAGCVSMPETAALPPPPVHPNGQALWRIISTQCLPGQLERHDPAPCALVSQEGRFVVLKDREGVAQQLVMPTDKVTGIEDPKVLAGGAPNYFAEAWDTRRYVDARLPRPLPREAVSIAVNSIYGRSQDQLHLHVDCLDPGVQGALAADAPRIGAGWSAGTFVLAGHPYRIRRIDGERLAVDPFRLLAETIPGAARTMGAWTLVLVGETSPDGRPGFYLIAARADPAAGEHASGEMLQDHACRGRGGA
jgi:CDP-diacylglycerol pyrophosphatase